MKRVGKQIFTMGCLLVASVSLKAVWQQQVHNVKVKPTV
jgi:hypothetical protein